MVMDSCNGVRQESSRSVVERGFTVGEVLLVASLLTFASTGIMSLIKHGKKDQNTPQLAYQKMILKGRDTVDRMVQELQQAGTPAPEPDENGVDATAANSNRVAASQFLVATPTHLIFEADLDHDGAVERVEYRLDGQKLERSAVPKYPDGTAPKPRYEALLSNVDNGNMPLFSYTGDPFGPPASQSDSDAVRILLLLRAPAVADKQTSQTVGFEGVARRQNAVAARETKPLERSSLTPAEEPGADTAAESTSVEDTYAKKWTLR
jgi:type II secretory pathway component PulJ